jgi:RNase P subunit RPR2
MRSTSCSNCRTTLPPNLTAAVRFGGHRGRHD